MATSAGATLLAILKGLSHKEIASVRAATEATVRQQAQAIDRKAGLPGKTGLSAYFTPDLAPAPTNGGPVTGPPCTTAPRHAPPAPGRSARRRGLLSRNRDRAGRPRTSSTRHLTDVGWPHL